MVNNQIHKQVCILFKQYILENSMVYVYILELEDGFYYVGSAADTNIRQRLSIYADPNHPNLPGWVRLHKFRRVIAVIKCLHQEDENKWVKIMMKHFTHDKVRGGSYSQTRKHLETVRSYFLQLEMKHDGKRCLACEKPSWQCWIKKCPLSKPFFDKQDSILRNKQFESQLLGLLKQKDSNQFEGITNVYSTPESVDYLNTDIPASINYQLQKVIDSVRPEENKRFSRSKREGLEKIERKEVEVQTEDMQMIQEVMKQSVEVQTEDIQMLQEMVAAVELSPSPQVFHDVFEGFNEDYIQQEINIQMNSEESFYSIAHHQEFAFDFTSIQMPDSLPNNAIFSKDKDPKSK